MDHCPPSIVRRLSSIVSLLLLASCSFPGSVPRTVKIGLVAPFEGLYRDLGYEALHAVRLAVRERNGQGGVGGRYLVEMVALNDFNEAAEAAGQAAEMAVDPDVLGVLGGWSPSTARVLGEYERLGLAFRSPQADPREVGAEVARLAGQRRLDIAIVAHGPDIWDVACAEAFGQAFQAQGGLVVALPADPSPADVEAALMPTPDGALEPVRSPGLFVTADPPRLARWLSAARRAGFTGAILGGPELGSALVTALSGEAAEGGVFVSPYSPPPDDPAFVAAYEAVSGGAPPGPVAAWAYSSANALLDAFDEVIRERGRPDRLAVASRLRTSAGEGGGQVWAYVVRDGRWATDDGR